MNAVLVDDAGWVTWETGDRPSSSTVTLTDELGHLLVVTGGQDRPCAASPSSG